METIAAGFNFKDAIKREETIDPVMEAAAARETRLREVEAAEKAAKLSAWQPIKDIAGEMLTSTLISNVLGPRLKPDPNFTDQRFEEMTKEAVENGFPLEWLPELEDAHSEEHFNYLLARAQGHIDAQTRLGEAGWGVWGANFLANMLDPTSIVIAGGIIAPAYKAQQALRMGLNAQRASQAAAGALSGAAVVTAEDVAGHQPTAAEYLFATGLGALLGGAFGPIAKNPATADEAAALVTAGQRMIREAEVLMLPPPSRKAATPAETPMGLPFRYNPDAPPISQAGVARAAEATNAPKAKIIDDPERVLEVQIEAHRLHIEEAKAQLKGMKRGSPEAEEVRLAAVAAQKDMKLLEDQLKRFHETGEVPPSLLRKPEPEEPDVPLSRDAVLQRLQEIDDALLKADAEGASDDLVDALRQEGIDLEAMLDDLPDEIADALPDPAVIRQRISELEDQLRAAGDEDTADEIATAIQELEDQLTGFRMFGVDDGFPELDDAIDAVTYARERQKYEMRLKGAIERGEDPDYIEFLRGNIRILDAVYKDTPGVAVPNNSVGAAVNPDVPEFDPIRPDFLGPSNDDWRTLKPGSVPRPAYAKGRIDHSGYGARTGNEAAQLVYNKLFNNTVGMADHSPTQWSTDLHKNRLFDKLRVPYLQARKADFVKYANAMGYNRVSRVMHYDEFDQHVGLALKSNGEHVPEHLPLEAQEAIRHTADALRPQYEAALLAMQEARLPNAALIDPKEVYMPRKFDKRAIQEITADPTRGQTAVENLVRGAIKSAHDEAGLRLDDDLLDPLAKGYAKNVINRAYEIGDDWTIAIREGDRARFAALLRQDTDLTDEQIDRLMRQLWSLREKSKASFGALNKRILLDEFYRDPHTGLAFYQLLDNNANRVFTTYANQVAGRVALANMKLHSPVVPKYRTVLEQQPDGTTTVKQIEDGTTGGDLIFDGIRTDADEQRLFGILQKWAADHRVQVGENILDRTKSDIDLIKFTFDRLKGIPNPKEQGNWAKFLRNMRDYNFIRLMWQGGIAQSLEAGTIVGTLGMKAAFSQMPGFRRIIDAAGNSRLAAPMFDELEAMGIGVNRLHGMGYHHLEQVGDDLAYAPTSPNRWDRVTDMLSYGTKVTNEYSAMGWVTQMMERWAGAAVVQRLADIAGKVKAGKKLSRSDQRRLAQLSLTEEQIGRIFAQFEHVDRAPRTLFKGKITRLNVDRWTDPEARAWFEQAVYRYTKKLVQTVDLGNTALWMTDPNAKTLLQFRNFTFTAWQNHTLYNLHMRDMAAVMTLIWGLGWAGAVRGAQIKAIAALRPDGREYEKKNLEIGALARAAFQRTGPASLLPAIIDTVALFTGQGALFDARHTGQPTDVVGGSPPISFLKGLSDGVGGGIDALVRQRPISQAEVRAIMGSLPMATFIPFMSATSHMIKDLPKRAPQRKPLLGD